MIVSNPYLDSSVISFSPNDRLDLVNDLCNINVSLTDPLGNNYQSLNWNDFQVISIFKVKEDIVEFSVAWHRPKYYKPGEIRIMSKYYKNPKYRHTDFRKKLGLRHIILMVEHQMAMCKAQGFTVAFISREKSPRYFRKLINSIQEKTSTQWHLYNDKQCVCVPEAPSCWQYKASTKL